MAPSRALTLASAGLALLLATTLVPAAHAAERPLSTGQLQRPLTLPSGVIGVSLEGADRFYFDPFSGAGTASPQTLLTTLEARFGILDDLELGLDLGNDYGIPNTWGHFSPLWSASARARYRFRLNAGRFALEFAYRRLFHELVGGADLGPAFRFRLGLGHRWRIDLGYEFHLVTRRTSSTSTASEIPLALTLDLPRRFFLRLTSRATLMHRQLIPMPPTSVTSLGLEAGHSLPLSGLPWLFEARLGVSLPKFIALPRIQAIDGSLRSAFSVRTLTVGLTLALYLDPLGQRRSAPPRQARP